MSNVPHMPVTRHFTATGFVIHEDRLLLHWHPKVGEWLPPGGHVDENEDPVQTVLREIAEETGVVAEVVPTAPPLDLEYPAQVQAPFTIMVEDIDDPVDGYHQHIDMIYFCRLAGPARPVNDGWRWVSRAQIAAASPLDDAAGRRTPPPEDVRVLAARAFEIVEVNVGRA